MSFKHFFQFQDGNRKKSQHQQLQAQAGPKTIGICDIFREGLQLKDQPKQRLMHQFDKGVKFFNDFNESRIALAFESFDTSMRYALYEILYLLHVNNPRLQEWSYRIFETKKKNANENRQETVNLYLEGAPAGVKSIEELSPVFKKDFEDYIQKTFDERITANKEQEEPFEGIYSIGSIGTVGHKNIASDLDLEVQFNLEPSVYDTSDWDDELLRSVLVREHNLLIKRYYQKKGIDPKQIKSPEKKRRASEFFKQRIEQKYPLLFSHLISKKKNIVKEIRRNGNQKLRYHLIIEVIDLMKQVAQIQLKNEIPKKEQLLKQRVQTIQEYIQKKFPESEVYLFPFSRQDLQRGYFGSTLDSKESSGGAYELILNYETLMPGIYFTPVIPSHFLFSQEINNNSRQFDNFTSFLQFDLLDFSSEYITKINHQGPTPDLDKLYVAKHYSAAYWEAFKASSGNLPKATLNILRYEMLLEDNLGKTNIQLIKDPTLLDKLVTDGPDSVQPTETHQAMFTPNAVIALETEFPRLKYDPWWLRFKALKIAFSIPNLVKGIDAFDLKKFSRTIDFAFALHIRLSDVFTKPGEQRKFDKHREKVLKKFLDVAFPADSEDRDRLQATFIGDVNTVATFENNLKELFLSSVDRIKTKVKKIDDKTDDKESQEFEIWNHYYEQSFKPKQNVVQKCILNHLQVPRGRLQIGFKQKQGWFFKSLQRGQTVGKRFESSIINLLPEEITLTDKAMFLNGLVYCVINGYYGIFNKGMLNETKTEVEYDRKHTNLGSKFDNQLAFVRPDQIERIMKQILELFGDRKVNYLDCIRTERTINEVMVFLNLLKYGRLSILYRDNLKTIFVDQFDIPRFVQHAEEYISAYQKMLKAKTLHVLLNKFLQSRNIDITRVKLKTWVNSNCVETTHSATKFEVKENELASAFYDIIMKIHSQKAN